MIYIYMILSILRWSKDINIFNKMKNREILLQDMDADDVWGKEGSVLQHCLLPGWSTHADKEGGRDV